MRRITLITASLAALGAVLPVLEPTPSFAADEEGEEGDAYTSETVVFAQRRLVMAQNLLRPELSLFLGQLVEDGDTIVGIGAAVDWTPIDKLQVGALGSPRVSPDTAAGDPMLYVRYLLLEGMAQLAVQGGYTFIEDAPGVIHLGVPLRLALNPAARLDIAAFLDINLPESGEDLVLDLNLPISLGVSLTRAIYLELGTGLFIPDFDFDFAAIPLGLELGYSIEGKEDTAFIDIFLRVRFDSFLSPSPPEGVDALNLDHWTVAIGGRVHVGLD